MRSVCVFCGSSPGADPRFFEAAAALGLAIAQSGRVLVYGGAKVGLMGAVADAALTAGGSVIGVLPQALVDREVAHRGLTELHIVASMHERKRLMADRADAFVAMPGGLGTLEELFEVWTWGQLGLHQKPIGLFGPRDFFAPLVEFLDHLVTQRFVKPQHRAMVTVEEDPGALLEHLASHQPTATPQWLDRSQT
ncbi:MAG: TIGR00730 family Rossman fold protein [Myxococcales bacterium]|nr:MAG: TIGR00730 family Rossman fold protein [Myxococcales bacterium]